jgi:hypothetical protein
MALECHARDDAAFLLMSVTKNIQFVLRSRDLDC